MENNSSDLKEEATINVRKSNKLSVSEVKRMWNISKIFNTFQTKESCILFCEEEGLIARGRTCRVNRLPMVLSMTGNSTVGTLRCRKGSCRMRSGISRSTGTWLENVRIPLPQVFYLMFCYASHWSHDVVRKNSIVRESILSSATICDWYNYCREAVVLYQVENQEAVGKIGGPGKKVQIDESKFGKRKFNKGRSVEGHWVLGMIADENDDLRLEVCPDNVRSAEVLIPLIKKHVAPGITISTDCWKAYDGLANHGYEHRKVNHSDPDNPFVAADGTHTQRIESQWRVIKRFFARDNNPENFADRIFEYVWRKNVANRHEDPFVKLLEAIKFIYKP
ncbi:uncharacterized protein LOC125779385 [Bactrocera dorsalis]|uniref:Uncharacterized protein LOC125779385 n=1 Tax=Bactrocera dorsalis TaxID=27457 RepID=A0ABM3K5B0_BACDO|nr:uncharacterized protein LOC125779385 [Bactrocera dorsalis]